MTVNAATPGARICLACSMKKLAHARQLPAQDMYTGDLFKLGVKYAKKVRLPFFILSAKYGFIEPETVVDRYDTPFTKPFSGPYPPGPVLFLGGRKYFGNAPEDWAPLVPFNDLGYMRQAMGVLLRGL